MELVDLHVGSPVVREALSVFPVWNAAAVSNPGYQVHATGVVVGERPGTPDVGELAVTNTGPQPALIVEGELLEGGWQHRVATRSILVESGSTVGLAVRCVEQGRWSGCNHGHSRGGGRAPAGVRAAAGQHDVWERVRRYEARYGDTATHSLIEATDQVDHDAAALIAGLHPLPFQTGVLIGIAGQPLLLEVFDSPNSLNQVWDGLLHAAAVDAVHTPAIQTPGRRARRFTARTATTPLMSQPRAGIGVNKLGTTPYVTMAVLVWQGRAVHTVAINPRHPLVAA